jgi:hypothetical protein
MSNLRRAWLQKAVIAVSSGASLFQTLTSAAQTKVKAAEAPLQFAAIGDLPYSDFGETTLRLVLDDIARTDCQFVVHIGDLKSSSEPCSNELFARRVALLQASPLPLIFTPGDNEWVDCARSSSVEAFEPEDRLQRIRALTTHGDVSLGQKKLALQRQSLLDPNGFAENARWLAGSCGLASINLAGSFNGVGQNNIDQTLRVKRDTAAVNWLRGLPVWAKQHEAKQIVVLMHANPDFDAWPDSDSIRRVKRLAYTHAKTALQEVANKFAGPVLVIHGDTHRFRSNRPWPELAPNLQRLEVFGSPFISSWVKVSVNPIDSEFTIEPLSIGRR